MTESSPTHPSPLAIVTGASSGIGKATAILLAHKGHRTLLIARRKDRIETLAAELSGHAPSFALPLDLEDAAAIGPAIKQAVSEHGPVDLLINNAGNGLYSPMLDQTMADHHRIMQVHYFAAVEFIHAILPAMLERKRGHIINIASMATKIGPAGHAAYAAAKCALVSLTQSMAADYAGRGVAFSYVNPGLVRTEFFDGNGYDAMKEMVDKHAIPPQRVAKAILGLVRRPKLEVCVPALFRFLDVINAVSPSLAHWVVRKSSRPQK